MVPTGPAPAADQAAAKAAEKQREIERLQSGNSGLFEHLLRVANVNGTGSRDGAAAAAPAAAKAGGNGAATAAAAAAPAVSFPAKPAQPATCKAPPGTDPVAYEKARKEFLAAHSAEYGYNGQLDALYPTEVRHVPYGHACTACSHS